MPRPIFHLKMNSEPINAKIVINRVKVVIGRPFDWTSIDVMSKLIVPKLTMLITDLMNHGNAKQTRMSKMFDPIELQMAISARPARFKTSTLDISSGNDVPAAKMVKPPTVSGMPNVSPLWEGYLKF